MLIASIIILHAQYSPQIYLIIVRDKQLKDKCNVLIYLVSNTSTIIPNLIS